MEKKVKRVMPVWTFLMTLFLIVIGILFLKGETYRLYASAFFLLYHVTQSAWVAIILVAVVQNLAFLPLRFLGEITWPNMKEFTQKLEEEKDSQQQYFLLKKKVYQGDFPVFVYTVNFVLLLIAFISAGRVFLLDFYSTHSKIEQKYLYSFVPYPEYPMQGVIFPFPFFKVTETFAIDWQWIILFWVMVVFLLIVPTLLWRSLTGLFGVEKPLFLDLRIKINRIKFAVIGIVGSLFLFSLYFLRNIPKAFEGYVWTADLSKQNTTFNIVTSLATFVAAIYMGNRHHKETAREAKLADIDSQLIEKVYKQKMKETNRNAFMIAVFAYWLTHQMPCSHDLSVLAFEAVYIIASFTIDPFLRKKALAISKS